ncbi:unnamed protein product [Arctia plantaginis]|uniref:Salivary secreted peptide n=1 Tax=Arctia plantaginis TaxID=874455 RepID=A0A8S0Z6Z9_ARCPL|nr:unnamed protein product [Arctia plantaginis]CAB3258355.1 unnamed protein product [Arctia plantaginis]
MWSLKFMFLTALVFNLLVFTNASVMPRQATVKPESTTELANRDAVEPPNNCPEGQVLQPDGVCNVKDWVIKN